MSGRPIHVVVVAYHAADSLAVCLARLERHWPVTVIDNSSSPDVALVTENNGGVYVDSGRNLGFAAAVNKALGRLGGQECDVLLLNPDASLGFASVNVLARFLHSPSNSQVAVVSPRLRDANQQPQQLSWPFPSPGRMWAEAFALGRMPARHAFVVGAVLLLRWEALADVGGFDERFFLYAEEADWQLRARLRGWTSAVCREVVAEHAGAGSSANSREREARFHAAQETYIRKWYGRSGWWSYRVAACLGAAMRAAVLKRERRANAFRRMVLYLRGPSRCAAAWRSE